MAIKLRLLALAALATLALATPTLAGGAQGVVITVAYAGDGAISMGTPDQPALFTLNLPRGTPNYDPNFSGDVPATWPEIWQGVQYTGFENVAAGATGSGQDAPIIGVDPSLLATWRAQAQAAGIPGTVDQFLGVIAEADAYYNAHYAANVSAEGLGPAVAEPLVSGKPSVPGAATPPPSVQPPVPPEPTKPSSPTMQEAAQQAITQVSPEALSSPQQTASAPISNNANTKTAYPVAKTETPKSAISVMPMHLEKVPAAIAARVNRRVAEERAAEHPHQGWPKWLKITVVVFAGLVLFSTERTIRYIRNHRYRR